jgi:hypothetical protein
MTVSSSSARNDYVGDGSTATYSYTFRIFVNTDLLVTKRDTLNTETTLLLNTDYTVTGAGDANGGTIVLTAGNLATDFVLSIRRARPITQETDIRNQGDFFPEVHEDSFDHSIMVDQAQQDELDRSVKVPESVVPATDFDPVLPADIDGAVSKAPITNTDGDGWANASDWPSSGNIADAEGFADSAAASAAAAATSVGTNMPYGLNNVGIQASVAASALTIDLVQSDGSSDPTSTAGEEAFMYFRNSTATNGGYIQRTVTAALNITVPSGATLGHQDGVEDYIYVYAIDNSGTVEMAVSSSSKFDDGQLVTTTAIDATADSFEVLYSDTLRSNVPCRLIGRMLSSQTTAGTWDAAMTRLEPRSFLKIDPARSNEDLINVGIATSVATNAMTIALKQGDGATDASDVAPCFISFRDPTVTTGGVIRRAVRGALSVVIPSGATLGQTDAEPESIYVYAINNAGSVELAVSSSFHWNEANVQSTTAIDATADSASDIYSTSARSNVSIRLLGRITSNQTTAGTYAANATNVTVGTKWKELIEINQYAADFTPKHGRYHRVSSAGGISINLPDAKSGYYFWIKDFNGLFTSNIVNLVPAGADTIEQVAGNHRLTESTGSWFISTNGTTWSFMSMYPGSDAKKVYAIFDGGGAGSDTVPTTAAAMPLTSPVVTAGPAITVSSNVLTFPITGIYEARVQLGPCDNTSAEKVIIVRARNTTAGSTDSLGPACESEGTAAVVGNNQSTLLYFDVTDITDDFELQWVCTATGTTAVFSAALGEATPRWRVIIERKGDT